MYNDGFRLKYGYAPIAIGVRCSFAPTEEHFHNEIEMLLIEKGSCVVKIGNDTFSAKPGDMFFVNPLEKHSITRDTEDEYFHRCICFDTELIADKSLRAHILNGELLIPHRFECGKSDTKILTESFLKLFEVSFNNKTSLSLESVIYISAIFLHLVDNSLLLQKFHSKKEKEFCYKTEKYISENYDKKISSKDIAEALFYSQNYFCRAFKNHFDVSFTDYLNIYRIYKAKEFLIQGKTSVAEISEKCGFESPTYFARIFKKHIGMTPSEFQKVNSVR
jgi:AraC-like DNA-binding protein